MRGIALLAMLVALTGCDENVTGPTAPLNQEFTLAPGQTAAVSDTGLKIRFIAVVEDSRCPADAVCVRAGDAVVRIDVTPANAGKSQYDLHTEDPTNAKVTHGAFTIALVRVAPYPSTTTMPIPANDYRATLRVTR